MQDQSADLDWVAGDVPVSRRFDDPYFSLEDGLDETRHVFLAGNDLPARFRDGFHIAELGFGTGLNLLAAWALWQQAGVAGTLHFTSFEAHPMGPADQMRALAAFPSLAPLAEQLVSALAGPGAVHNLGPVRFELITGDARMTLPAWEGRADAWFLDGFSPAKNPELWEAPLMAAVAGHTRPGGTAATYTAAGHIRRALGDAGFTVERVPGYGRKRHMTRATLP